MNGAGSCCPCQTPGAPPQCLERSLESRVGVAGPEWTVCGSPSKVFPGWRVCLRAAAPLPPHIPAPPGSLRTQGPARCGASSGSCPASPPRSTRRRPEPLHMGASESVSLTSHPFFREGSCHLLHGELVLLTLAAVSRLWEEPRAPAAWVSVPLTLRTAAPGSTPPFCCVVRDSQPRPPPRPRHTRAPSPRPRRTHVPRPGREHCPLSQRGRRGRAAAFQGEKCGKQGTEVAVHRGAPLRGQGSRVTMKVPAADLGPHSDPRFQLQPHPVQAQTHGAEGCPSVDKTECSGEHGLCRGELGHHPGRHGSPRAEA